MLWLVEITTRDFYGWLIQKIRRNTLTQEFIRLEVS